MTSNLTAAELLACKQAAERAYYSGLQSARKPGGEEMVFRTGAEFRAVLADLDAQINAVTVNTTTGSRCILTQVRIG